MDSSWQMSLRQPRRVTARDSEEDRRLLPCLEAKQS